MLAAVDLHQLAQAFAPQAWLVEVAALPARQPQPGFVIQLRSVSRETFKLMVARPASPPPASARNPDSACARARSRGPARHPGCGCSTAGRGLVGQAAGAARPIAPQQPMHLPCAQRQDTVAEVMVPGTRLITSLKHLDPLQLPFAHLTQPKLNSPSLRYRAGRLTFLLCSGVTF